jgi:hypothetical protein
VADAIVGAVIMVAITTGLMLAVQVGEQAIGSAGRYPLNAAERELLQSAGWGDSMSRGLLQADLEAMPQQ